MQARTTDTRRLNIKFFAAQIQFLVEIMLNNGKHGQGTHSTKMGADSPAENTPNAPKHFSLKCLPKPKLGN